MCVYYVLQINLFIMKTCVFDVALPEIEFLNESEMQSIRGGIPPLKPKSRPREIYDDEID